MQLLTLTSSQTLVPNFYNAEAASCSCACVTSCVQACPLIFSLDTNGPFKLLSAVPSAPQDPVMYRGTTGLTGKVLGSHISHFTHDICDSTRPDPGLDIPLSGRATVHLLPL